MGVTLDIGLVGMLCSGLLVLLILAISHWQGLGLERRIILGVVRTVVQLMAVGYILAWIFSAASPMWTLAAVAFQIAFAVLNIASLLSQKLRGGYVIALYSLLPTYIAVAGTVVFLVIRPEPAWDPRFLLPLGGMLVGNSLTGVALALNRYRSMVAANHELIMARLSLAARWNQAVEAERQQSAEAAMLPTISAMLTVGIVSLPGMMTGQIIAGADPVVAVKYQIVVMFMIAGATGLAVLIALNLISRREYFENFYESGPG